MECPPRAKEQRAPQKIRKSETATFWHCTMGLQQKKIQPCGPFPLTSSPSIMTLKFICDHMYPQLISIQKLPSPTLQYMHQYDFPLVLTSCFILFHFLKNVLLSAGGRFPGSIHGGERTSWKSQFSLPACRPWSLNSGIRLTSRVIPLTLPNNFEVVLSMVINYEWKCHPHSHTALSTERAFVCFVYLPRSSVIGQMIRKHKHHCVRHDQSIYKWLCHFPFSAAKYECRRCLASLVETSCVTVLRAILQFLGWLSQ